MRKSQFDKMLDNFLKVSSQKNREVRKRSKVKLQGKEPLYIRLKGRG